MKNWWIIKR